MNNQIQKNIYRVVVYLRLSADDGDNRESDSISNQRLLIHGYLEGKPEFTVVKECVDDGFTGTNFDRPGFREMMEIVKNGEADTILVKDLSRFGRDFSGVLQYVERILPKMGVRLILLNDNYDSETSSHDFITLRLKSFINDIYPADTSRSVRANLLAKMKAGQCVASFALYGYLKSPEDKHRLIMDPAAASVVQDIFQLKLKGHSMSEIAAILNVRGILTPLMYRTIHLKQKISSGFQKNRDSCWCATMVRRILTDERYTGVLIQGKRTTPNHKVKKVIYKSASEWIRYEDAFEAVVDKHTFEVVQSMLAHDTRRSADGIAILSGLVECADCRQSMVRKSPDRTHHYYVCSTSLYEKECQPHRFNEKKLVPIVQESVLHYISIIVELRGVLEFVEAAAIPEQRMFEADQVLRMQKQEYERISQIKRNLYDSFCEGILDEEEYRTYKKKYDLQLGQAEDAVKKQQATLSDMMDTLEKQKKWMEYFLCYKDIREVDRMVISMLVKRIRIHSGNQVSIDFWFADEFERMVSLLQTVNEIQPNEALDAFLNRKGGVKSA